MSDFKVGRDFIKKHLPQIKEELLNRTAGPTQYHIVSTTFDIIFSGDLNHMMVVPDKLWDEADKVGLEWRARALAAEATIKAVVPESEEAAFAAWFDSQQGIAYDGSYSFARAAWMHRAAINAGEKNASDS